MTGRRRHKVTVIRVFALLVFVAVPGVSFGGGTVGLAELEPLLGQKPQLRAFLMSSLDLDSTAMAAVRFGSHMKYLEGARMGPYMIQARPRTPQDAPLIEVILCTDARFFDVDGKATTDETNAVRVEEKLITVMLREVNSLPAIPSCP